MTDPRELPQQVAELIELTKQYLRQETIAPMKRLVGWAAQAGLAAFLMAIAAVLLALSLHGFFVEVLPSQAWWEVAAAGFTSVAFMGATLMLAARLRSRDG